MSEITKLRLWNDPGFLDGAVEVPSYNNVSNLPAPKRTLDNDKAEIVPSKNRFFSELKVRIPYSEAQFYSYLEMTVEYNDLNQFVYFGFIDSVTLLSDTEDYPQVAIGFHIDCWRTYLRNATFGSGLVTRRPRAENDPIQNVTARYRKVSDKVFSLIPDDMIGANAYWAIINYTYESDDHRTTEARVIVVPVAKDPSVIYYMKLTTTGTKYQVPTLEDWLLGEYDEILGLAPSSISSVFISPVPPLKMFSGTGSLNDPFVVVGSAPAPTPTTRTYSGINQPRAYAFSNTPGQVMISDGRTVSGDDWNSLILRSISGAKKAGYGGAWSYLRGYIKSGGTTILSTDGDDVHTISAMPIDEFMRAVLTEAVFNTLQNGDTIEFSNIDGLYSSGSLTQRYHREQVPFQQYDDLYYDWTVELSGELSTDHVFTFNNGTFGSGWVVVDGEFSLSTVELTTYSDAPTTAEYGFMIPTGQSADPQYAVLYTKTDRFAEYSASLTSEIATSDTEQFVVTDLDGSIVASLPWGLKLKDYTFRCVISATSAYVQFRFDGLNSSAEGLQVTVPLPTLDITSNSWSEYLYSGQRDFDIEQRKIARDRALVEGLSGALSQGATGAMIGGLKESAEWMPTTRSIGNAVMFGGLGAVAGVAGSAINYATSGVFNDRIQGATDLLQAQQIDAIITPGGGCDWLYYGRPYQIRSIVPDEYSLGRFENEVSLNGIIVSEPTSNCTNLIKGSGPLRIENLIVGGNIPAEAKQFIKNKLERGVRLI